MAKIGLSFGTQTGNTQTEVETMQQEFGGESIVELIDVSKAEANDFERFENIIIGCPPWNVGELQSDWKTFYDELDNVDLSGKKVAYFGPGDVGYPDTFEDAMGILEEKMSERGGKTVGYWPIEGYEFSESQAIRED